MIDPFNSEQVLNFLLANKKVRYIDKKETAKVTYEGFVDGWCTEWELRQNRFYLYIHEIGAVEIKNFKDLEVIK